MSTLKQLRSVTAVATESAELSNACRPLLTGSSKGISPSLSEDGTYLKSKVIQMFFFVLMLGHPLLAHVRVFKLKRAR